MLAFKRRRMSGDKSAVDFAAVTNVCDGNGLVDVINLVDDAVIPETNPPAPALS